MNKFLRLHNVEDNSVVIINASKINVIDSVNYCDKICSEIYLETSNKDITNFIVNETAEKIYQALDKME